MPHPHQETGGPLQPGNDRAAVIRLASVGYDADRDFIHDGNRNPRIEPLRHEPIVTRLVLLASSLPSPAAPTIRLTGRNRPDRGRPASTRKPWTTLAPGSEPDGVDALLALYVEPSDCATATALAGHAGDLFHRRKGIARFTPGGVPLSPGVRYRACFHP